MNILAPKHSHHDYTLLDSGNGHRLEQFGTRRIIRSDATCIWQPNDKSLWARVDLTCTKNPQGGGYRWREQDKISSSDAWTYTYNHPALRPLTFALRSNEHSKNVGIFPEQAAHWDWLGTQLSEATTTPNILNLFAYTGGATLVAAAAGAQVCHVDAAKSMVTWAKQNAEANGLAEAPIRWIAEDCLAFMNREIKRGKKYDGIIMDPPAFGRDPQGNVFNFETAIDPLLEAAEKLLTPNGFLLLNAYSIPFYAMHIANVVRNRFPLKSIISGELHLRNKEGYDLPCNVFVKAS